MQGQNRSVFFGQSGFDSVTVNSNNSGDTIDLATNLFGNGLEVKIGGAQKLAAVTTLSIERLFLNATGGDDEIRLLDSLASTDLEEIRG